MIKGPRRTLFLSTSFVALLLVARMAGQDAQPAAQQGKLDRAIGEVTSIDAGQKQISVKTDSGAVVTAVLDDKTLYLRVPPGEKDLKKASRITLPDVVQGDRAFIRGHLSADQKSISAVAVIIMTKAELAKKHERDREEWRKRGLAGTVTTLNPEAKEITISARTREGTKPVVVEARDALEFRRYAPDSVRFSDAKASAFEELKIGDQLRVLGDKNADTTRIKAQDIVSGSFRNIAGVIRSVDADAHEIKLTDLVTHKPVTIVITSESTLRKMPPWMAMMMARRQSGAQGGENGQGGPGPAGAATRSAGAAEPAARAAGGGRPPAGEANGRPAARATEGRPAAGDRAQWQGGGGGGMGPGMGRGAGMDIQDALERMPALTLAELKPGDAIMLSGTNGADPSRVTAINLLTGVEALLTAAPQGGQQVFGAWSFDIGMPE
jgi:Cu/Ag efflux protein CusF